MAVNGFNENEVSENNKEALQSETWKQVRTTMKTEIQHFTDTQEKSDSSDDKQDTDTDKEVELDLSGDSTNEPENKGKIIHMGTVSLPDIVTGNVSAPTPEESASAKVETEKPAKECVKEKLDAELKLAKDKSFAEPIIAYLLKRCEEDEGLASDVSQSHKTWDKCISYIYDKAKKQSKGNCAAVRYDVVYEWAEDYYHLDDKAEADIKAKKAAEQKKKAPELSRPKSVVSKKENVAKTESAVDTKKLEEQKPKKNSKDMEGQLDLFSMMGM